MTQKRLLYLQKVQAIQVIYLEQKVHDGITDKWIYETYVRTAYFISYTTFRMYLLMNVKRLLAQSNTPEQVEK